MSRLLHTVCSLRTLLLACLLVPGFALPGVSQTLFRHPPAGSIYRDYSRAMILYSDWRVTDPGTQRPDAQANLPNTVLNLPIADLQGATRAEAIIDLWGGHWGTTGKKIRFNGKAWISIPEVATTPTSGECYSTSVMITVDIPLLDLKEGNNTFEGTNTGQTCYDFDWGQHGQFGIIVRVYYNASKPHPVGLIASPINDDVLAENPAILVQASGSPAVDQVELVAYYNGYDTDGDGIYQDWQYNYHRRKSETSMMIHDHVGTAILPPYSLTWNTSLVPDQAEGSVRLQARIRNTDGIWFVTDEISGLTIQRNGSAVKLYRASNVPERFAVRSGRETKTCSIAIPAGEDLSKVTQVRLLATTWNGMNKQALPGETGYTRVNSWTAPLYGADEHWSFDAVTVPIGAILTGTNVFTAYSNSSGFGISVQWPGPGLLVRYDGLPVATLPEKPTLALPANGAPDVVLEPVFSWTGSPAATSFRLQISRDAAFTQVVVDSQGILSRSAAVGQLEDSSVYYWRVLGKNGGGLGPWSEIWSFMTLPANQSGLQLLAPLNGALEVSLPPTLIWRTAPGASAYWFQLASDSVFSGAHLREDTTLADTSIQVVGLQSGSTYFWRVSSNASGTFGPFTLPWRFRTGLAAPEAVELLAPAQSAQIGYDTIHFLWNRGMPSVSGYWFELGFDPGFAFRQVDSTLTDTVKTLTGLLGGQTFYWRVRARNASGWGAFSPVRSFERLLTSVDGEDLPQSFALEQNYPNPFNPSTLIVYTVPATTHVRIEVTDILGSRVRVLVDETKEQGRYSTRFDAAGLPSGVYLYRMQAGSILLNRRMLLVK